MVRIRTPPVAGSRPVSCLAGVADGLRAASNGATRSGPNPPGALAIVNGEEIGPTPVSRIFYYYGDREITFLLDGYETKTVIQPINAPWWDNLVTEFFTENLVPFNLRDEREFTYKMDPGPGSAQRTTCGIVPSSSAPRPASCRRPGAAGILGWLGFD